MFGDYVENKQEQQVTSCKVGRNVSFEEGDRVMVDDHRGGNKKIIEGKISKKLSPATYKVEITPSLSWKRHADQMIPFPRSKSPAEAQAEPAVRRSERIRNQEPRRQDH